MSFEQFPRPDGRRETAPGEAPAPSRPSPRGRILAGVATALALGLGLGLLARPMFGLGPAPAPMPAETPAGEGQVQILVNPERPAPVPNWGGPLEVLPADMAQAAPRAPDIPPASDPPPEAPFADADAAEPAPAPAAEARPSFDCAGPLSRAQQMVCDDPRLADDDRRLARAYRRALQAGAPADGLREEQADWRAIREDAAQVSPRAVAQIYEQRIRELEDLASDPPRGGW